jgi:hypothetical protein
MTKEKMKQELNPRRQMRIIRKNSAKVVTEKEVYPNQE